MIKSESEFRDVAVEAVIDYWNANRTLSKRHGRIDADDVYIVWQVKVLQNFKALLGVNVEGDGMYFEITYDGDKEVAYFDAYRKATNRVIAC